MEIESIPSLLITANVGSVFEDPSRLLKSWIKEFLTKVTLVKPQFLALHLQEVGGKTYEKSMEYVQEFIKILCESDELAEYTRIRVYLDEDYNSAEHFTALGNLYFIHKTLNTVKIWNFLTREWEIVEGSSVHTGNIEAVATKEKSKFPQHFFPECKWSRKGFLRTRWELNCTVIDLVNIHLFHDASNLAACEEFPSVYCKTRRRALVHTLERFHKDFINGMAPYFVFGDFNFRCDTEGVIKKLTEDLTTHRIQNVNKSDSTKVQYRNSDGHNILTVGKKEFNHTDHQTKFKESWLQQFDKELDPLREVLVEYPITFPPSYPYEEEPEMPKNYMSTRCPSWCDRILMSPIARELIVDDAFSSTDYNIIGENICMGDHKPVYLSVHVKTLQGIIRCSCYSEHDNNQSYLIDLEHKNNVVKKSLANCLYSCNEFYKILLECRKLDNSICQKITLQKTKIVKPNNLNSDEQLIDAFECNANDINHQLQPSSVSINITDAENLKVCICSLYSSSKITQDYVVDDCNSGDIDHNNQIDGSICPECRNIIKKQPTEHRYTHYLTTYTDSRQEPYTPESAESHSPYPEMEFSNSYSSNGNDLDISNQPNSTVQLYSSNSVSASTKDGVDIFNTSASLRGVVTPRQLKSRLENLQRTSFNSDLEEVEYKNLKPKKRCSDRCCILL